MHLRIGNFDVNPDCIVMIGPGQARGTEGVYLNASACPTTPFIAVNAAQLKTIRTQWQAYRHSLIASNGTAAPPGRNTARRTAGRTRKAEKAATAGSAE